MDNAGSPPSPTPTFRQQAFELFQAQFGKPEILRAVGGDIYRWRLKRGSGNDLYITLDSPELPTLAHVLISDPASLAADPIGSMVMRTLDEVHAVIERVKIQWKAME